MWFRMVTTDKGLNANLWNLSASSGKISNFFIQFCFK